jgi:integrase
MHVPKYCHHKGRNLAYVKLDGRMHYLGTYDTDESKAAYYKLIAEYKAAGNRLPSSGHALTTTELVATYHEAITSFTLSASNRQRITTSLRLLRAFYGPVPAADLTPHHIKACREHWLQAKLTRQYINILTGNLLRMLRWAAEELLIPLDTYRAIEIIAPLKAGRCTARESIPDCPVSRVQVDQALPHCSRPVRALIELQWLTGARPGELLTLRPMDLDTTAEIWSYRLEHHKTAHRGKSRTIYFGPQAQAILKPFLLRPADAYCFSPKESNDEMQARYNPPQKPKPPKTRNRRSSGRILIKPKAPKREFSPHFDVPAYRRHIARACTRAGIDAWHPHQLRHAAATRFRDTNDLDVAQVLLGHDSVEATQIYARVADRKAREAAAILC